MMAITLTVIKSSTSVKPERREKERPEAGGWRLEEEKLERERPR
jgi:hypothetical protein